MSFSVKIFTIAGFLCLFYSGLLTWERNNPARLAFSSYTPPQAQNYTRYTPQTLHVPSLEIKLPIVPTKLKNGSWATTNKGVSYLASSPLPGSPGNSIFYGHNFNNLLGNLSDVKMGEKIEILYSDGSVQTFYISGMAVVTPDQTHVLQDSKDIRLTIYTCTGFFDSKRLVVTAVAQTTSAPLITVN